MGLVNHNLKKKRKKEMGYLGNRILDYVLEWATYVVPRWKDQNLALKIWPLLALDPALLVEMMEKPKGLRA